MNFDQLIDINHALQTALSLATETVRFHDADDADDDGSAVLHSSVTDHSSLSYGQQRQPHTGKVLPIVKLGQPEPHKRVEEGARIRSNLRGFNLSSIRSSSSSSTDFSSPSLASPLSSSLSTESRGESLEEARVCSTPVSRRRNQETWFKGSIRTCSRTAGCASRQNHTTRRNGSSRRSGFIRSSMNTSVSASPTSASTFDGYFSRSYRERDGSRRGRLLELQAQTQTWQQQQQEQMRRVPDIPSTRRWDTTIDKLFESKDHHSHLASLSSLSSEPRTTFKHYPLIMIEGLTHYRVPHPGKGHTRSAQYNEWRGTVGAMTRGACLDYEKNHRIRCDPVRRWQQYQECWRRDTFLHNHARRKLDVMKYRSYLNGLNKQ